MKHIANSFHCLNDIDSFIVVCHTDNETKKKTFDRIFMNTQIFRCAQKHFKTILLITLQFTLAQCDYQFECNDGDDGKNKRTDRKSNCVTWKQNRYLLLYLLS